MSLYAKRKIKLKQNQTIVVTSDGVEYRIAKVDDGGISVHTEGVLIILPEVSNGVNISTQGIGFRMKAYNKKPITKSKEGE